MAIQLTRPLVVPEYGTARVKAYIADPVTSATVVRPPYTIDVQAILTSLIPGRTARANACALNGADLFITNSSPNSQCVFKLPNYLFKPEHAAAQAFIFSLDGNDYVGMAFDASGNLFVAEGDFLNNHIVRYTGTAKAFPGAVDAAKDNYATRSDLGNAGATSYFANLSFDAVGNLWVSDYKNHRIVVFDAANLGGTNTFHVLANLNASIPVANTNAALKGNAAHLFAEPEGIDFDAAGHLWVANNNDNGAGGVQNMRTSLVRITPSLQAAVLATAAGGTLTPTLGQANTSFFVVQVPNLANDAGARPQFGGLQIDRTAGRLFVNEEIAGNGRGYDIATIAAIGTATAANDLAITSTNPGNGGLALVNTDAAVLFLRDNTGDTGAEPNTTTSVAWESPDIWPRQNPDGGTPAGAIGEDILGGSQAHLYVRVTNRGLSPSDGTALVRLYWAKASAGLAYPAPWNGAVPANGGSVNTPQSVPSLAPGQSELIHFVWPSTPNPAAGDDGHFCLLAQVVAPGSPEFDGFQGGSLQQNVLALQGVGWRNIHIVPVGMRQVGHLVMANATARDMLAQVTFETLGTDGTPDRALGPRLVITPDRAALDRLRSAASDRTMVENLGNGTFRVLDAGRGLPPLLLRPANPSASGWVRFPTTRRPTTPFGRPRSRSRAHPGPSLVVRPSLPERSKDSPEAEDAPRDMLLANPGGRWRSEPCWWWLP